MRRAAGGVIAFLRRDSKAVGGAFTAASDFYRTVSMLCLTWLLTGGIRFQQHAARQPPLQCSTVLFAASFATHNGTVCSHRFLFSLLYFTHLRLSSFSSISRTYLGYPVKRLTVCGDCPSKIINTTTTTTTMVVANERRSRGGLDEPIKPVVNGYGKIR